MKGLSGGFDDTAFSAVEFIAIGEEDASGEEADGGVVEFAPGILFCLGGGRKGDIIDDDGFAPVSAVVA